MHKPTQIVKSRKKLTLKNISFEDAIIEDKKSYRKKLKKWQKKMLQVQQAYFHQGRRALIVFEGWDASGKGGAIRRITEKLDPRGYTVHPFSKPSEEEQGKHYLYRFYKELPAKGKIALFDRSYYGRVLVERIENLATHKEWQRAYQEINEMERTYVDDGLRIVKIFLHITKDEQLKRFEERLNNPMKRWKLTEEDIRNRDKWTKYEEAIDKMFAETTTNSAKWHIIPSNRKWYSRLETLKLVVRELSRGVELTPPPLDHKLIEIAESKLGIVHNDKT